MALEHFAGSQQPSCPKKHKQINKLIKKKQTRWKISDNSCSLNTFKCRQKKHDSVLIKTKTWQPQREREKEDVLTEKIQVSFGARVDLKSSFSLHVSEATDGFSTAPSPTVAQPGE